MRMTWANRISILRILLIVPFVICMLKMNQQWATPLLSRMLRYVSLSIFLVMAVSDAIDGYLARRKGQSTKLGAFLDPTADKLLMTSACLLLASSRGGVQGFLLPPTVVVFIIGKDVLLSIGFVIMYFMTMKVRIVPVTAGKAATALQLSMVAAVLISPEAAGVFGWWEYFLQTLWWSATGTAILATFIYIREGTHYIEEYGQNSN